MTAMPPLSPVLVKRRLTPRKPAKALLRVCSSTSISTAMAIAAAFAEMMHGQGRVAGDEDVLEDGIAFAGVAKFPARVKCALLPWMAWKDATNRALEEKA